MNEWSQDEIAEFFDNDSTGLVYFYTPICGTCKMAGKMLEVVERLFPSIDIGKANLNYLPAIAERFEIKSVPCLLLVNKGQIEEKVFAFQSVPYLYEKINRILLKSKTSTISD